MVTRTIRTVNRNISTCETSNSSSEPLVGRPQHCSSYVDVREVITESTEYSITAEIVGDLDSHLSYVPDIDRAVTVPPSNVSTAVQDENPTEREVHIKTNALSLPYPFPHQRTDIDLPHTVSSSLIPMDNLMDDTRNTNHDVVPANEYERTLVYELPSQRNTQQDDITNDYARCVPMENFEVRVPNTRFVDPRDEMMAEYQQAADPRDKMMEEYLQRQYNDYDNVYKTGPTRRLTSADPSPSLDDVHSAGHVARGDTEHNSASCALVSPQPRRGRNPDRRNKNRRGRHRNQRRSRPATWFLQLEGACFASVCLRWIKFGYRRQHLKHNPGPLICHTAPLLRLQGLAHWSRLFYSLLHNLMDFYRLGGDIDKLLHKIQESGCCDMFPEKPTWSRAHVACLLKFTRNYTDFRVQQQRIVEVHDVTWNKPNSVLVLAYKPIFDKFICAEALEYLQTDRSY